MRRLLTISAATLLLGALLLGAAALPSTVFAVQDGSGFWIDGTSTVSPYTCSAERVTGTGRIVGSVVAAEVVVPVRTFDCGVRPMNRDFYRALRGDEHPQIRFALRGVELIDEASTPTGWATVRAFGTLELAGVSRSITVVAEGRYLDDGTVRVRGRHPLRMTHFEVEPPSGMLGLVRAHDEVVARFDLIAAASEGSRQPRP